MRDKVNSRQIPVSRKHVDDLLKSTASVRQVDYLGIWPGHVIKPLALRHSGVNENQLPQRLPLFYLQKVST